MTVPELFLRLRQADTVTEVICQTLFYGTVIRICASLEQVQFVRRHSTFWQRFLACRAETILAKPFEQAVEVKQVRGVELWRS